MSCTDYEIELGDYVDGTLDGAARAAFEAHLSTCARCQALVADFGAIRQAVGELEAQVPSPQVWTRLSAALEDERSRGFAGWTFGWRTLASAAVAVTIVVSLSWVGARLVPINGESSRLASRAPADATSVGTEFDLAEAQYTTAIAGLESITKTEQSALDSGTVDVLQANLTVIDGAITESRAALQTEPDSQVAQESLFEALRSKVQLLQDIVALINEMRQGNTEEAARIVSGLNQ